MQKEHNFVCSFCWRIYGGTNCFYFYLTFKAVEEEEEPVKPLNYEFSELFSEPKEDAQVCEKKKADLRAKFEINQINRGHTGVKVKKLSENNPPLSQRYGARISEEEKAKLKRQSFPKLGFCENEDLKGLQEENQEEEEVEGEEEIEDKGQIKPKADWVAIDSPKIQTNEFVCFLP